MKSIATFAAAACSSRTIPKTLRCHPALGYYEKDASGRSKKVCEYPAMLACIQKADGHAVTLHRTYLKDGKKAAGRESKKVLSAGINGAAVRLFEPSDCLAITEGVETALAIHLSTAQPVWAALSAGNMEKLWVPDTVQRISIYADNDANSEYKGQSSAFVLAGRLKKEARKSGRRRRRSLRPEGRWCRLGRCLAQPCSKERKEGGVAFWGAT